jgi:tripartite-type tricarboxylate transporter receptor subunit TctC
MTNANRRDLLKGLVAGAAVLTFMPNKGWAANWPRRPITLVIQYSEGGGTDTIIRAIARAMEKKLGVSLRAVNQPGAGGALATEFVAQKESDGNWLLGGADYNKIFRVLGYTEKAPWMEWQFMKVGRSVPAWAVAPNSRFKTLTEVVEAGRANPGTIRISNAGIGTIWHEATLVALERKTGAKFVHVPYDGGATATLAILQGEADVVGSGVHEQVEYLRSGKIRNLAVFRTEPLAVDGLAEPLRPVSEFVPTATEIGLIQGVYEVAIKRDVPKEVLEALQNAVRSAVQDPDFVATLRNRVMFPEFKSGEEADKEAALFESVTSWLYVDNGMQGLKKNPKDVGIPRPEEFEKWWPPKDYKAVL